MKSDKKIKIGTLCGAIFVIISYLVFRTDLPKIPNIFLYNLVIIISLQALGFYRGLFFLGGSVFLTVLASLAMNFNYIWNVPVFLTTFLIVKDRIKKLEYFSHIIEGRVEEIRENTNLLANEYKRHQREAFFLEKKEQRYRSLKDVTSILSSTLSLDRVTELILDNALEVVGRTESLLLFLVDTKKQELNLAASRIKENSDKVKAKKGDLLDEWVFKQRQRLLVEDIKKDFRFSEEKIGGYPRPFRSVIACPLMEEKKVVGIVRLEHSSPHNYKLEDLRLLDILCDLGAASLQNARLYKQTLDLAITDGLTGLYLRRYFLDRLREELARSLRGDLACSFVMIDIDDFKNYNDKYGHTAGDIVLRTISKVLTRFAQSGIVGRYGGEEFSILLPETPKKKARRIADDIRSAVREEAIELRRVETHVTVSIGVSSFPEDSKVQDDLIQKADERLYMAKRQGKDRVAAS
ncbi:MAG: sensor domain-containing diguanylate cyclase [Candidatus Omnitrophica bacterium]|nr:sensor domain-containing diguanylate cyclase [Candidatus Omnitrophota bacterium]